MTHLEITLIIILWTILGIFNCTKQYKAVGASSFDKADMDNFALFCFFFALLCAPLWFIATIIRQVVVEDWR